MTTRAFSDAPDSEAAFAIALRTGFRRIRLREGLLIRGRCGWGEFSPFLDYGPAMAARWLRACLEAADEGWPAPRRGTVAVNAIVPAVGPELAQQLVRSSGGCRTVKVKVAEPGQRLSEDIERLEAVRDALGPNGLIRLDANGAWQVQEAIRNIRRFERIGLEYVEQPCATLEEMAQVRRAVNTRLAADESLRLADDPSQVRGLREAADVLVLKVQPLGGVRAALRIAEIAGLPAVVSSAIETSVGLAAGLALAAALPELPFACGLGTGRLLEHDVVDDPLVPVDGHMVVRRPNLDFARLAPVRAPERLPWWRARRAAAARELRPQEGQVDAPVAPSAARGATDRLDQGPPGPADIAMKEKQ